MKPLTNLDIDKIMIKCDNYRGTFSKDMLPKAMNKNESAVVNLQELFLRVVELIGFVFTTKKNQIK